MRGITLPIGVPTKRWPEDVVRNSWVLRLLQEEWCGAPTPPRNCRHPRCKTAQKTITESSSNTAGRPPILFSSTTENDVDAASAARSTSTRFEFEIRRSKGIHSMTSLSFSLDPFGMSSSFRMKKGNQHRYRYSVSLPMVGWGSCLITIRFISTSYKSISSQVNELFHCRSRQLKFSIEC